MDVVFFDIDDTLYDQARPFAFAVRSVLGDTPALRRVSDERLFELSREHSGAVFAAFEAGSAPTRDAYAQRMRDTLAAVGIEVSREVALRIQDVYAHHSDGAMRLMDGMDEVLDLAGSRARVGVITNGKNPLQTDKLRLLGMGRWLRQRDVFVSATLGVAKPDRRIFDIACRHMGTVPGRCAYVGDAWATDVVGALGAGMEMAWFNHRRRPAGAGPAPTWEVRSTGELLEALRTAL